MKLFFSCGALFAATSMLTGCMSSQDQAQSDIQAGQSKLRSDTANCQSIYKKDRKTIMQRVKCINDAYNSYPYWPSPDLVAVMNAERLVSAERFRDGKISEAELDREIASTYSRLTGIEQSRINANRALNVMEAPPVQPVMVMPMPGMAGSTYRPMCPPGPYGIACRGY